MPQPHVGDRIVVESEHVGRPAREGVIEEVLMATLPRYRVRWDDGHTSIISPSAGAARVAGGPEREQGSPPPCSPWARYT
jgi:Domain of unknown function (DUF1918)